MAEDSENVCNFRDKGTKIIQFTLKWYRHIIVLDIIFADVIACSYVPTHPNNFLVFVAESKFFSRI